MAESNHSGTTAQFGKRQLQGYRRALLAEREREKVFVHNLEATGLNDTETGSMGELSSYDQHPADHGSETFEREKDTGLRANAEVILERIERALERIEEGSYGTCESCGKPIDPSRLKALPYAVRCVACAKEEEEEEPYHRPIEEESLSPPFGRTFTDDEEEQVGFDGEDAWQEVAKYGTSNSPQDVLDAKDYEDAYVDADEDVGVVTELDAVTSGPDPGHVDDDREVADLSTQKKRRRDGDGTDGEKEVPREGETR